MNHPIDGVRRSLLAGAALLAASAAVQAQRRQAAIPVEVWKDEGCGCCDDWAAHLDANGFRVTVHDGGHAAARERLGIAARYGACHTGAVQGYALEGHVPAADIHRLLRDRPQAVGLAVPGMPLGSPGMDGAAAGGRRDVYEVLLLARDGSARVWRRHAGTPGTKA